MIGPAREVDVHFCARKERKKKLQANLKLGHGCYFFVVFFLLIWRQRWKIKRCVSGRQAAHNETPHRGLVQKNCVLLR